MKVDAHTKTVRGNDVSPFKIVNRGLRSSARVGMYYHYWQACRVILCRKGSR